MARAQVKKELHWLNKSQMAASLGISAQAFDKWGVKPVAKIGRETFYEAWAVVENRLANFEERNNQGNPDMDPDTIDYQRFRLTREQADAQQIKNEQARARLVPIDLLTAILSKVAGEWAGLGDTLPLAIKRKHPELDSAVIENIKWECVKMQNAVARLDEVADEVIADHAASIDPE